MKPVIIGAASIAVCLFTACGQCRAEGNVLAYLGPDAFGQNSVLTIEGDHRDNQIRVVDDAVFIEADNSGFPLPVRAAPV